MFSIIKNYLIENGYNFDGTTTGNKIAKSMTTGSNWKTTSDTGAPGNNLSLNNKSGFSALPTGYRFDIGVFGWIGEVGYWWSSTEHSEDIAWSRRLYYNKLDITRYYSIKEYGYSVRCVKD